VAFSGTLVLPALTAAGTVNLDRTRAYTVRRVIEIGLSRPVYDAQNRVKRRSALRGCWFSLEIEVLGPLPTHAFVKLEGAELEHETLRETIAPSA
jgi:hypothetical protein